MSNMNRRDLLKGLATIASGVGVVASISDVPPEPLPLLFVLRVQTRLSDDAAKCIRDEWSRLTGGCEGMPPLVILDSNTNLEAVVDPRVDKRRYVSAENGCRGKVYDAHGVEIDRCVDADLVTGRCTVWETDTDGLKTFKTVDYRAAPLRFVPLKGAV